MVTTAREEYAFLARIAEQAERYEGLSSASCFSPEILTLSPSQLTINASEPASKQIVILHDSPSSSPTALIKELIGSGSLQVASLYVTDDSQDSGDMNPYNSFPTFWNQFVADVAAAATS